VVRLAAKEHEFFHIMQKEVIALLTGKVAGVESVTSDQSDGIAKDSSCCLQVHQQRIGGRYNE
jgi:hypothetical protein